MKRYFANKFIDGTKETCHVSANDIKLLLVETIDVVRKKQGLSRDNCDGGLYVGVGGVGYMFWKLSNFSVFDKDKDEFLKNAQKYLSPALAYADSVEYGSDLASKCGFLLGNTGIYATAALVAHALGDDRQMQVMLQKFNESAELMIPVNILPCGSDELLVGRAGLLAGIMTLRQYLGTEVMN